MNDIPKRDPEAGRIARDAGIDSVMAGEDDFATLVYVVVVHLPKGWRGTGEDIRIACAKAGVPKPHHHNAWGGVMHGLLSSGLLEPTREWLHMNVPRSHRRLTPEYIRI